MTRKTRGQPDRWAGRDPVKFEEGQVVDWLYRNTSETAPEPWYSRIPVRLVSRHGSQPGVWNVQVEHDYVIQLHEKELDHAR